MNGPIARPTIWCGVSHETQLKSPTGDTPLDTTFPEQKPDLTLLSIEPWFHTLAVPTPSCSQLNGRSGLFLPTML